MLGLPSTAPGAGFGTHELRLLNIRRLGEANPGSRPVRTRSLARNVTPVSRV